MNHSIRLAAIPFALAFIALPSPALPIQAIPVPPVLAQGMFSNFASGITVGGAGTPNPLVIRAPGVNGGVPVVWNPTAFTAAAPEHPEYTMAALTHWAPSGSPEPSFGGISTGGEVMPAVNSSGELLMGTSNWYMLSISVDSSGTGASTGIVAQQSAGGRDASGDILSYYAVGSEGINGFYVDKTWVESTRRQLKLNDFGPQPPATRSILNFDYGMGVISVDPQGNSGDMFPVRKCFYFTLTQAWVDAAPSNFQLGGVDVNASTVYVMEWNSGNNPPWSAPAIAFSHNDLFDESVVDIGDVEIDALSVDKANAAYNLPPRVVFSLTMDSNDSAGGPFDQILVHQRGMTAKAVALRTDPSFGTTEDVSDALGLVAGPGETGDPANVTGTCGGDPHELLRQLQPVVAIATDEPRTGAGTLGFSAMRTCTHPTPGGSDRNDTLHLQITGMNFTPHMFGAVRLYTESDALPVGSTHTPGPSTAWGSPFLIDSEAILRNTIELTTPLPCAISGKSFRFSAEIVGVDPLPVYPYYVITPLRESCVLTIKY